MRHACRGEYSPSGNRGSFLRRSWPHHPCSSIEFHFGSEPPSRTRAEEEVGVLHCDRAAWIRGPTQCGWRRIVLQPRGTHGKRCAIMIRHARGACTMSSASSVTAGCLVLCAMSGGMHSVGAPFERHCPESAEETDRLSNSTAANCARGCLSRGHFVCSLYGISKRSFITVPHYRRAQSDMLWSREEERRCEALVWEITGALCGRERAATCKPTKLFFICLNAT